MDATSRTRLQDVHPVLAQRAMALEAAVGFPIEIVQGKRSVNMQAALWYQGRYPTRTVNVLRAGLKLAGLTDAQNVIVTNARPMYGWHEFGLAFDAAPLSAPGTIDWNVTHPSRRRPGRVIH